MTYRFVDDVMEVQTATGDVHRTGSRMLPRWVRNILQITVDHCVWGIHAWSHVRTSAHTYKIDTSDRACLILTVKAAVMDM